ncbi:MAG: hypothetical protein EOO68_09180 [Moraxellaceae bacterium]|nr:MAG: hypothetical protein EOO68_09180 [Moraxellaceae bacterium]
MYPEKPSPLVLTRENDYWEAANRLASRPIYLYDNPLFKSVTPSIEVETPSPTRSFFGEHFPGKANAA